MILLGTMKKRLIITGAGLIFLAVIGFFVFSRLSKPGKAALQISASPNAKVFLNGEEMGTTLYFNDKLEPGEYSVKLVPEGEGELASWEGQITLVSNIQTFIKRQFGPDQDSSSGEIISLEKAADSKTASLSVVSQPDGALVKIDGESKGFAPVQTEIDANEYQIEISTPGFLTKTVKVQTIIGYKLTLTVQLARQDLEGVADATPSGEEAEGEEETETEEEEAKEEEEDSNLEKPYVKIKETPTGWLRVRLEPSTSATEAAKVNSGETFPYLDEEENGWYKIEYEADEEGWISGVYAELFE